MEFRRVLFRSVRIPPGRPGAEEYDWRLGRSGKKAKAGASAFSSRVRPEMQIKAWVAPPIFAFMQTGRLSKTQHDAYLGQGRRLISLSAASLAATASTGNLRNLLFDAVPVDRTSVGEGE